MRNTVVGKLVLTSAAVALAACSSSPTSSARKALSFSFATQPATAAASMDVTVGDGTNTLVITKAQVVVRKLELKRSAAATCPETDTSTDDCDEVKAGPFLVDLPLTAGATSTLNGSIPAGTYRELELKIHKPTSTTADQAFVTANPNFADASVRVEGTYNGTAFVYTSKVTAQIELEFNPPITLDADNKNVTIKVNLASWFMNGTSVINPTTANPGQPNESLVNNNIRSSLRGFEDDDRNGHDDDGVDDADDH